MTPRFAVNHVAAPRLNVAAFAAVARGLGLGGIEIRNDLPGVPLMDGTNAALVRAAAEDMAILTINALQRFEAWNQARAAEAERLAAYAAACGAAALVLVPTNDPADPRDPARRAADLREALTALRPILARHGLRGFVEPLGFAECALRLKSAALAAIDETGGGEIFAVVHDTFHHHVAGEAALFPTRTGLVHISGVEADIPVPAYRDSHRVLVGPGDRIDNVGQIAALRRDGYQGAFSFEPFAESVQRSDNITGALQQSMAFIRARV